MFTRPHQELNEKNVKRVAGMKDPSTLSLKRDWGFYFPLKRGLTMYVFVIPNVKIVNAIFDLNVTRERRVE